MMVDNLNVSREACLDFEKFIDYVLKKNEILNIIETKNKSNKKKNNNNRLYKCQKFFMQMIKIVSLN